MAKNTQSVAEKLAKLDKMTSSINAKHGRTVVGRVSANPELREQLTIEFIETPSVELNDAIGGGYPRRRVTIVSGVESAGKTGNLLETIALNQKKDPAFVALWCESEDSLDIEFMNMLGVDLDRFVIVMHDKDRGAEVVLDELIAMLEADPDLFDFVVINSLKALVPKKEFENSLTQDTVALQARLNAKLMRKLGPLVAASNAALVLVNHLTTNIGQMHGDPMTQGGGRAIRYWATVILDFRKLSIQATDPITSDEGMKVAAYVRKNRCVFNRNPYVKTEFYVVFGEGTEQILGTLDQAIQKEILNKAGAWIREIDPATGDPKVLQDGTILKWQGKVAFKEFCKANPEYFEQLKFRCGGGVIESLSEEEIAALKAEEEADALACKDLVEVVEAMETVDTSKKSKKKNK